jgi:hypothetical protein
MAEVNRYVADTGDRQPVVPRVVDWPGTARVVSMCDAFASNKRGHEKTLPIIV